ncbi:hypothetical protein PCI56_03035 [Plesiomonas shigelloides subsp. oncorhynchi]|nr:hypothetical protein [Plesiomonas shigelloides]
MDILANAGGPTRYSESRQIRIIRANGSIEPFDLQGYTEGLTKRALPPINPGDAIFIPEKPILMKIVAQSRTKSCGYGDRASQ